MHLWMHDGLLLMYLSIFLYIAYVYSYAKLKWMFTAENEMKGYYEYNSFNKFCIALPA